VDKSDVQMAALDLHVPEGIDGAALLVAIAEVESQKGERRECPRHESAYCYGGFYYKSPNGDDLRAASEKYGCLAHCSFGSWQIMYITARELGFNGKPTDLNDDTIALPLVVRYMNRRILDRFPRITVAGIADAYNTGRPDDAHVNPLYINAVVTAYGDLVK